jgi:putative membrane protein
MIPHVPDFLIHWAVMSLSLWVASFIFYGLKFENRSSLFISALLLGFVNAVLRPILIILTLPLTLVTLGLFALVINALMVMLVAKLVKGFKLSGFWTAFFVGIFIALFGLLIELLLPSQGVVLIHTVNPNTISI